MKRFLVALKSNGSGVWQGWKRYKKKKGAIDAVTAIRKKTYDLPKHYNLDVIKIIDSNDNSVSLH